jgi:hypothetical protein
MNPFFLSGLAIAIATVAWPQSPSRHVSHEMTIVAHGYAFDAPDTIAAGVTTIRLENHGPDLHDVAIVRLDAGHTPHDFIADLAADGPFPSWATYLGGPNAPVPGMQATATIALTPGHYLIACLIRSPDSVSHMLVSHVVKGMVRQLTVVGHARPAPLPVADVTMTLLDYGFELSQPLVAGTRVIRVRNVAAQPHEVFMARLPRGVAVNDLVLQWLATQNGPPPVLPIGGLTPISPGTEANITVDLAPGEYGLYCFVPDARDGQSHVVHGMMRQITVEGVVTAHGQ